MNTVIFLSVSLCLTSINIVKVSTFTLSAEIKMSCVYRACWLTSPHPTWWDNTPSFKILLNKINIFLGQNALWFRDSALNAESLDSQSFSATRKNLFYMIPDQEKAFILYLLSSGYRDRRWYGSQFSKSL